VLDWRSVRARYLKPQLEVEVYANERSTNTPISSRVSFTFCMLGVYLGGVAIGMVRSALRICVVRLLSLQTWGGS